MPKLEERSRGYCLLTAMAGALTGFPIAADCADDLKLPVAYRRLLHVNTMVIDKPSPLFEVLGGMYIVHVNSGESALKKGGPYPNGTVFLIDLHESALLPVPTGLLFSPHTASY
jgi:hypothetical protein